MQPAIINGITFKNIKKKAIENCFLFNCEIDGAEECSFAETKFEGCVLKGKWKKNAHPQLKRRDIFINCTHTEEHELSSFDNVTDFEKIKQKDCSNNILPFDLE